MLTLLLAAPALALDPLQNPGFEAGDFSGWTAWGPETAVLTDAAYEGTSVARLTLDPTQTGFQQTGLYQDVQNAVSGEHLQFTILARVDTADPVTADGRLLVKWEATGSSGYSSSYQVVPLAADGTWTYGKVGFTTPEGATSVRYVLLFEASTAGADGAVSVDMAAIAPYVDDLCAALFDQTADADSDGIGDDCDRCPADADPDDVDDDADGVGDICDACAGDNDSGDADGDGICADLDDCDLALGCNDTDDVDTDCDLVGGCDPDDTDVGDDTDAEDKGCGCDHRGSALGLAPWAVLALIARRRRADR